MKRLAIISFALLASACAADDDDLTPDEEWGMDGPMFPTPPPGKEDSEYRRGLLVATDTTRTQVWSARNKWEDTATPAAAKAGLAWPANSGLTWDQKYVKWIESLAWIPAVDGYSTTVKLTTPWGKELPGPSLECAEMSLFLRITFAAWYELPLFFESVDSRGVRVYFGHNGVRTASGRYAVSPEFAIKYKDHTATWSGGAWPSDGVLRGKRVAGGDDSQPMLSANARFGAYLDEIHLNKRAGYFTILALDYLGSANLADSANTYNIIPDAVRAGDSLVERWQRTGIGHTLVVKEVAELPGGSKDVTVISGSMPRRQGVRQSGAAAKGYFTSAYTGGPGANNEGHEYARLGGGIKRWRVAKNINGYWTNTWMAADEASWINSTDYPRIAARPARFEQILGSVSPEQQRVELLQQIADARRHLTQYPASCSARERREQAFATLYELAERELSMTQAQVDAQYRKLEDYVLGELEYAMAKTCCWNSSTPAMYDLIMSKARAEQGASCVTPTVFKSHSDGYARWAQHAQSLGRASEWRAWSEDEPCSQRAIPVDVEAPRVATPFCQLSGPPPGPSCTDAMEPNDARTAARAAATGTTQNLRICPGDNDWYAFAAARTVKITFSHAAGDLDMVAYDASGNRAGASEGTSDSEQVSVPAGGTVHVFGYSGATNSYTLVVQ